MVKLNKINIVFFFLILFSLSVSALNITSDVVVQAQGSNANYTIYDTNAIAESLKIDAPSITLETEEGNFSFSETPSTSTNYEVVGINFTAVNVTNSSQSYDTFSITDPEDNTISTTDGDLTMFSLVGTGSYTCDVPGAALQTNSISLTALSTAYQFSIYDSNSINVTFYDEINSSLIDWTDVEVALISEGTSYNFTTSTGNVYVQSIEPGEYVLRYSANGYTTRFYTFTLTNRSYTELVLYMLEETETDSVTVSIIDENSDDVENALVKSLRFDTNTNTYILQQALNTDANGQAVFSVRQGEDFYYFIVEYPAGTQLKQTTPALIYSDTLLIQIQTAQQVGDSWQNTLGINHNITFYNDTNEFTFRYNDLENTASEACLRVYDSRYSGKTLIDELCAYGAANTITVQVDGDQGDYYVAKAYVKINGYFTFVEEKQYVIPIEGIYNYTSLFFAAILILAMAMTAIATGPAAVVLLPMVGLLGLKLMGILSDKLTWGIVFSLTIVAIIIAFILKRRQS
jgi:hypothetical protein